MAMEEVVVVCGDLLLRRQADCRIDANPMHSNIHFTIGNNTFEVTQGKGINNTIMYIIQTHH